MKILAVEDNDDSRILLVDQLRLHGYEVESAENGVEALKKARNSPPGLIVSDILMPEMDGFEFCRQVKQDSRLNTIPFIFYSATYTDAQDKQFALSLGASRFVVKPEDPLKFIKIIEEVLSEYASGDLTVPVEPSISNSELEHMHTEVLAKKLDKKLHELEEQKRHLQIITDAMPALISDIGDDYRYRYVNKTYEEWYNISRSEIIGAHIRDIVGEETYQSIRIHIERASKGEPVVYETLLSNLDGPQRHVQVKYIPYRGEGGDNSSGFFELASDITERKIADQELQLHREHLEDMVAKRTAQLIASNNELEAFCYSVSHDLRAPLRGVNGFSQALIEDYAESLDSTAQDYLERIRLGALRMGELIDDLLMLSRVSRCEPKHKSVDLTALAKEIAENLQQQNPGRNVRFSVEENMTVQGDPGLIKIALENLLDNAWKFTAHTANPKVDIGTFDKEGKTVFYVRDNGAGFNMKYLNKLFGAFQRLHKYEEFPGTGIGLATVQRIVHRHGGQVWAEGEIEKGTSVYFTIPGTVSK